MARTPWADVSNVETTVDPTVNDDSTQSLDVGSRWTNTTTNIVWFCTDNSTGAAIWKDVSNLKTNLEATTDPGSSNDITQGYFNGSVWINTSSSPIRVFTAVSTATGAAIWLQTTNTIDNSDAPGLYFLGALLDYSVGAGLPSGEIQYARAFLLAGLTIRGVEVFVDSGGANNRDLRVGLYSQAVPTDQTGVPLTRVGQSNVTPTGGTNGTYLNIMFTTPYVISSSGFFWIALVTDSSAVKLISTPTTYRENYPPIFRQTVTGTTLPATASGLSNPASAIAFAAATE